MLNNQQICGRCNGLGNTTCGACGGYGYQQQSRTVYDPVRNLYTPTTERVFCYMCRGGGKVMCSSCGGTRTLPTSSQAYTRPNNSAAGPKPKLKRVSDNNQQSPEQIAESRFYCRRGYSNLGKKLYDQALSDFNHAIKLKPDYGLAYYRRGLAYQLMGDTDRAIADYEKVLEISDRPWLQIHTKNALKTLERR